MLFEYYDRREVGRCYCSWEQYKRHILWSNI